MRRFVDLHTHSTASDGTCPPDELIAQAEARRLAAVALTDHDTTAGLAAAGKAVRSRPKLRLIAGVEISAKSAHGTLHIPGLGIDQNSPDLQRLLRQLRDAREERNPKILAKLRQIGCEISMEDVLEEAANPNVVSRLHIALALQRKGYADSVPEAFSRFIGNGGPAFVEKERLSPRQAIRAIHSAEGLAFLAHPPQLNYRNHTELERIIDELKRYGLDGIEVYHPDHTPSQTRFYLELVRRYDLAVAGGSDFHGSARPHCKLGRPRVPLAALTGRLAHLCSSTDRQ